MKSPPSLFISSVVFLLLGSSSAVPIQLHYRHYGQQQPEEQQLQYFQQLQPQHRQQQQPQPQQYYRPQPSQWYGGLSSPTAPPTNNGNVYRSPLEPTGGDLTGGGGEGGAAYMAPMMMGSIRRAYHTYEDYMRSAAESFRTMVYKSWKMLG